MNIKKAISFGKNNLQDLKNPTLEVEILLAEILKISRICIKTSPEKKIENHIFQKFKKAVFLRKKRLPIPYIFGYKIWHDLKIFVNKNVLIPRDETEILCNKILNHKRNFSPKKILDIGTGSGNIAVFLKKNFPAADILATDICNKALYIAEKNANLHKTNIEFLNRNLLDNFEDKNFDIIVANLPYVPQNFKKIVEPEVLHEPLNAIFSGDDGLFLIKNLTQQLIKNNFSFKELWLEFLPCQEKDIKKIFSKFKVHFFTDVGKDIFFVKVE